MADDAEKSRFEATRKAVHDEIVAAQELFTKTANENDARQTELKERLAQRLDNLEKAVSLIDAKLDVVLKEKGLTVITEEPQEKKRPNPFAALAAFSPTRKRNPRPAS